MGLENVLKGAPPENREAEVRSKTDVIVGVGLFDNVEYGAEGVVQIYRDLHTTHPRIVPEQYGDLGFLGQV